MSIVISILIVIVALLLIFFVVIQNSKGGGLASGFSSSNQVMGVRKTTDFLDKATWIFAGSVALLCIVSTVMLPKHESKVPVSEVKDEIQNKTTVDPNVIAPPFGNTGVPQEQPAPQQSQENPQQ